MPCTCYELRWHGLQVIFFNGAIWRVLGYILIYFVIKDILHIFMSILTIYNIEAMHLLGCSGACFPGNCFYTLQFGAFLSRPMF